MMDGFTEFGADPEKILSVDAEGGPLEHLEAIWTKLTESFRTHRHIWMASFDAFVQAEHSPEVCRILADGYEAARHDLASRLLRVDRREVDERDARMIGSFLVALQAGLAAQWVLDPEHSPSGPDIAVALRQVCALRARKQATPYPLGSEPDDRRADNAVASVRESVAGDLKELDG
jgi:hypothetical protein